MTPQEAIRRIKAHNEIHSRKEQHFAIYITEALNMACTALEMQIPKKPIVHGFGEGREINTISYTCPNCDKHMSKEEHHCECGQALEWGE